MNTYRVYLFGAPRLEYHGKPVSMDTRKAMALLAFSLITGEPHTRDTLAALFWPESNQGAARSALRRTLSTLRSALGEDVIDFGREIIQTKVDAEVWCDVTAFHEYLIECQKHGHTENQVCSQCLIPLQKAAEIYTGDFMVGFSLRDSAEFDDWQFLESDRLRRELMGVLERLVNLHVQQLDFQTAIEYARRWLTLDTLNESAHRSLIYLYAQSDQRNAALRQYRECVRILDEELGVSPLDETTQLYEAVKENRLGKPAIGEQMSVTSSQHPEEFEQQITDQPPLIDRDQEWKQLTQLYESLNDNGAFVALTGEVGIGKTRLAQEFITHLQRIGAVTLSTRCYSGESNLAYAPLIDLLRQGINQAAGKKWWQVMNQRWLSEVTLLIPELTDSIPDLSPPQPFDGPGAQSRFYEGVCQTLTALANGPSPGLLFIDNLEWADESTLDLLAYLARRLNGRPLLILTSYREEDSQTMTRLQQLLIDTKQQGFGLHLPLSPLNPDQSEKIIEHFEKNNVRIPSAFKEWLVDQSSGVPYFLIAYVQAVQKGEIRIELETDQWPLPTGLRVVLQSQLANLSGTASQILQAAAVIGSTFESSLLQAASGRTEEEIVQGIEELLAGNLILEVPVQITPELSVARYDFKQEQVRALVLEGISLVRRWLLHRRTAEALEELARLSPLDSLSGQIAYHYQQASMTEEAAKYYFQSGRTARAIHANADALAHFQAALAFKYPGKMDVLIELGDLYTLKGDYIQAIQHYEAAAAISEPTVLPFIEQKIGRVYLRRGYWQQAAIHFESALKNLTDVPSEQQKAFEAEIRADWSLACQRAGEGDLATSLAREALTLAESSGDPKALAQAHNLVGILARANQQPEREFKHLTESLVYARRLAHPAAKIAAQNNLALALADLGEYLKSIATLQDALKACINLGDRHLEAALRSNLADSLRASGQDDEAMVQLKQAVAIFAEIDQNVADWEPEIWKLVEW